MKNIFVYILALLVGGCIRAEQRFDFFVRVVSEDGKPMEGITVRMSFFSKFVPFTDQEFVRKTDGSGLVRFSGRANDLGHVRISEPAFYELMEKPSAFIKRGWHDGSHTDWEPSGSVITVVLKKLGERVPMYAKRDRRRFPVEAGKAVGYDYLAGDFVEPFGVGRTTDVLFSYEASGDSHRDFHWKLTAKFPGEGDGIVPLESKVGTDHPEFRGSVLRSPTRAPTEGYKNQFVFSGFGSETIPDENDTIYIFRVRTVLDAEGRVVSSLYGKMYRLPWVGRGFAEKEKGRQHSDWLLMSYYLNPDQTPNLEFNGKTLFENLPREQLPDAL